MAPAVAELLMKLFVPLKVSTLLYDMKIAPPNHGELLTKLLVVLKVCSTLLSNELLLTYLAKKDIVLIVNVMLLLRAVIAPPTQASQGSWIEIENMIQAFGSAAGGRSCK